jgi:hypothetical protein
MTIDDPGPPIRLTVIQQSITPSMEKLVIQEPNCDAFTYIRDGFLPRNYVYSWSLFDMIILQLRHGRLFASRIAVYP